jgi:hypothetical protein
MGCLIRRLRGTICGGRDYRLKDADEAGTSAEITCESFSDVGHGWMRVDGEQL